MICRIFKILFPVFLLGVLLFVYGAGLSGPFFYDDLSSIPQSKLYSLSFGSFFEALNFSYAGPFKRPISIGSFSLTFAFLGDHPFYFKLINLGLHGLNALLIYCVCRLLFRQISMSTQTSHILATCLCLFWLFHPIHISTVLYTVQRMTQLSALFILLGSIGYIWGRLALISNEKKGFTILCFSYLLCLVLAILSKENGALLPFYLMAIEFYFFKFQVATGQRNIFKTYIWMAWVLPISLGLMYFCHHLPMYLGGYDAFVFTLKERILTQVHALLFYIKLILLPKLSELSLYHDDFILQRQWTWGTFALSGVLAGVLATAIALRKNFPLIGFGILWFFISHGLESSILPLELVFEHRNYLASFGLILACGGLLKEILKHVSLIPRKLLILSIGIFALLFVQLSYLRVQPWANSEQFFSLHKEKHPLSPKIQLEWINHLLTHKEYLTALQELTTLQRLTPWEAGPFLHQLLLHCQLGSPSMELLTHTKKQTLSGILTPYALSSLDRLVQNKMDGHCPFIPKSILLELVDTATFNPSVFYNAHRVALLFQLKARMTYLHDQYAQTIYYLQKSFELNPNNLMPLFEMASTQITFGRLDSAQHTLSTLQEHISSPSGQFQPLLRSLEKALSSRRLEERITRPSDKNTL